MACWRIKSQSKIVVWRTFFPRAFGRLAAGMLGLNSRCTNFNSSQPQPIRSGLSTAIETIPQLPVAHPKPKWSATEHQKAVSKKVDKV
jgi:hypothetical protein